MNPEQFQQMKPHKQNSFQSGDEVKNPEFTTPGKVIDMFYLPYREGCKNGAPDTYYFPALLNSEDDYSTVDTDDYFTVYYGWLYIVAYTHSRDDEIYIFHENQLNPLNENDDLV
ncbi:MAG: hypothetical protein AAGA80_15755 [Cyanobacteria bacterium P01_F01_bin.143]